MQSVLDLRKNWTWKRTGDGSKNKIDKILISKKFKNALLSEKTDPGAHCYRDHVPVAVRFKLKLKKTRGSPKFVKTSKLDLTLLKSNQAIP